MTIPMTFLSWLAALIPTLVLLVCLLLRINSVRSALLALLSGAAVALLVFRSGLPVLGAAVLKGLWSALPIVAVVFTAIGLYAVCRQAGTMDTIGAMVTRITGDELLQILLTSSVAASFLQGITGYGVPIAVCAPLLIAIGVQPFWAVILPPLGHAWGNTFGTLAMAWDTLVSESGLSAEGALRQTALLACVLIWVWNLLALLCICWFYGGGKGVRHGLPAILALPLAQGGGELLCACFNTTLACFLPACLSLAVLLLLARLPRYRKAWALSDSPIMDRRELSSATGSGRMPGVGLSLFPYVFLSVLAVVILLVPPVKTLLSHWQVSIPVPGTHTGYGYESAGGAAYSPVAPLIHAAFFLLCSCLVSLAVFAGRGLLRRQDLRPIWRTVWKKAVPVSCSVGLLLVLSKLMSDSGMAYVLSCGLSAALGRVYAPFAPLLGLLGSLLTGSNVASNILFSRIQSLSAQAIGLPVSLVLAAQTAGGAIGCAVSPSNLMLGASMAGISGQEGRLLVKLLPPAVCGALLCGAMCLLLT